MGEALPPVAGRPARLPDAGTLGIGARVMDVSTGRCWIAKGHYVKQRVFADEPAAIAAGYRPCRRPPEHAAWAHVAVNRRA
jgi:hypothetical protein